MNKTKANNIFDSFLNECQTYVWEWYIPEQKVRFGIPSLNSLWIDDRTKNIKLATMLERVHPDDIQKVLVRHTSPLYRSDKMFEVDLRLNVASELMPDGKEASGQYEWYGFRGKTISRDKKGRPTYVRGIAINLDARYRAQIKLLNQKEYLLQSERHKTDYCSSVMQEMSSFVSSLAENANAIIGQSEASQSEDRMLLMQDLTAQAGRIIELTDRFRQFVGARETIDDHEIRSLSLWEHLAEQQQIYSLRSSHLKVYFSNLYDDARICVNVKLLDALLENLIAPQRFAQQGGCVTLSYSIQEEEQTVRIVILSKPTQTTDTPLDTTADFSLSLSVCRLLAKRLWGTVQIKRLPQGQLQSVITLPFDPRQFSPLPFEEPEPAATPTIDHLPHVLIGLMADAELYQNQHLFNVAISNTTHEMFDDYCRINPDIVFIDNNLPGDLTVNDLIRQMSQHNPDTPIIVSADYAERTLHKQIQQLGARYLLTNPLSLRKVNLMIKKYLK